MHEASGLDVICAPNDPGDADRIPVNVVTELSRWLGSTTTTSSSTRRRRSPSTCWRRATSSDALVLIATLDIPAVKNLRVAIDTLDMLGSPKDARIIVLNRADAKVGLRADDVVSAIKAPIAVNIPNSLTVPASVNRGVPIVLDDPRGPVSAAIRELADVHIRQRFGEDVEASSQRKSLFRGRR